MKQTFLALAALGCGWWSGNLPAQELPPPVPVPVPAQPGRAIADDKVELLTRGPIHEAFAQAVTPSAEAALVVRKAPPAMIEEIPPAQRPAGDDVAWIPGYFGWDDDRDDFIWISGVWRAMPPGREWNPGYWAKMPDGYQWTPGYWADIRVSEVEYLPAPPETVDAGPSTEAPTGSEIWIPGTWMWQQNKYVWRAGYWAKGDPQWMWTNAHYVPTTRGYLYVSGYWDFLLPQRGVLFAPVYFSAPVNTSYVYTPQLVINTTHLVDHLFLRPTYGHYYYGDYYAANYRTQQGILPWFVFNDSRHGYDPIYAYNRWHYRNDNSWQRQQVTRYDDLRDREAGRPPRNYADYQRWHEKNGNRDNFTIGNITDFAKSAGRDYKFRDFSDDDRRNAGRISQDFDAYRKKRMEQEAQKTVRGDGNDRSDRVQLLKPPIGNNPQRPADDRPSIERPDRPSLDRPGTDRKKIDQLDEVKPKLDRTPPALNDQNPPRTGTGDRVPEVRPRPSGTPRNPPSLPSPLDGDIRKPEKPGQAPKPKLDRLDEKPLKPGSIPVPGLDGKKSAMPRGPVERTPDARELGQPPKNPVNLPGPLNDIRNPPGKNGEPPPRTRVERDTPGPMNDIRDRNKDAPKGPPKADRDERPKPEKPMATPRPAPRETPRAGDKPGNDKPASDKPKGNSPDRDKPKGNKPDKN